MTLEISSLTVGYGEKIVLREISFAVAPGEIVALIGPNGAGKSTLIRAVSGVLKRKAGRVRFNDQDLHALTNRERAKLLAVVPQARPLGGAFSVEQTVLLGRTAHMDMLGRASAEDHRAVAWAMKKTGVDDFAKRRNAELSGGERQRVLLARALAQQTPILLLDEPTNHLDLRHQVNFLSLVQNLAQQENLAVLMALHDLNQVSMYADRVVLLVDGQPVALGAPSEVLTAENVNTAYQTRVKIISDGSCATPIILPACPD
jgi:iron complex transport system ATP-binding protein